LLISSFVFRAGERAIEPGPAGTAISFTQANHGLVVNI
jgi:hypothetical protein